jgi:hypothetical protein
VDSIVYPEHRVPENSETEAKSIATDGQFQPHHAAPDDHGTNAADGITDGCVAAAADDSSPVDECR